MADDTAPTFAISPEKRERWRRLVALSGTSDVGKQYLLGRAGLVADVRMGTVLREIRTIFDAGTVAARADGQLLERFATRGGGAAESAFATIVERHGPM